jgi:hypothetical protein
MAILTRATCVALLMLTYYFGCTRTREYDATINPSNDTSEFGFVADEGLSVSVNINAHTDIDLLKWAVTNSENARNEKQGGVERRQALNVGVDALQIRDTIDFLRASLRDATYSEDVRHNINSEILSALTNLGELVETVDSADYFLSCNGTDVIIPCLWRPEYRILAAKVLTVAASNNAPFQKILLDRHPRLLPDLIDLLKPQDNQVNDWQYQILHLTGSLLRTNAGARTSWLNSHGDTVLLSIIINPWNGDLRHVSKLQKRAIVLMTDLLALEPLAVSEKRIQQFAQHLLAIVERGFGVLVNAVGHDFVNGWDTVEKVLLALEALITKGHLVNASNTKRILTRAYDSLVQASNNGGEDEFSADMVALSKQVLDHYIDLQRKQTTNGQQEL